MTCPDWPVQQGRACLVVPHGTITAASASSIARVEQPPSGHGTAARATITQHLLPKYLRQNTRAPYLSWCALKRVLSAVEPSSDGETVELASFIVAGSASASDLALSAHLVQDEARLVSAGIHSRRTQEESTTLADGPS